MSSNDNDPAFSAGCLISTIIFLLFAIYVIWEKSPVFVIVVVGGTIAVVFAIIRFKISQQEKVMDRAAYNLENSVSFDSLILEEELRARTLENDMREAQIMMTFFEQETRKNDSLDSSKSKLIDRKMKMEELNLMRIKSEYEALKNKIRDMKDENEI